MHYHTMQFETFGAIAVVTMNRPQAANTVTQLLAEELSDVAVQCASDARIRSVILTGTGRFFSAGGDLNGFRDAAGCLSMELRRLTAPFHSAISRLARMDKPLITAINGPAAGAGVSLAVLGDFAIASDLASFSLAYSAAGLSPDGASTYWLPRIIGVRRTRELMMSNRTLSATEALEWGLINKVCSSSELMSSARDLAATLAIGPTRAYGAIRALLLDSLSATLETQMEAEARCIAAMGELEDGREGIAAFLEKRKPVFKGC